MDQLHKLNQQEEGEFLSKKVSYMIQAIRGALPKETVKNFGNLESDSKRFSFVWDLKEVQDVMDFEKEYEAKSAESAKAHRERGNAYFQKKSYLTALGEYNMGVIKAPWNRSHEENNAASTESQTDDDSRSKEVIAVAQICGENTSADRGEGNDKALIEPSAAEKEEPKNELALAFANRSAALFHLKKYRECLEDICLAIETGYPEESCYKLHERRGSCYAELGNPESAASSFRLAQESLAVAQLDEKARTSWSKTLCRHLDELKKTDSEKKTTSEDPTTAVPCITGGASSSHPDVSTNVRICYSKSAGRHATAGVDIKAGDVLMVDRPYASVLYPRFHKTHCYHCFAQVSIPIPCVQCTSVVYCGRRCRDASWARFHRHECEFFALFDVSLCAKIGHLAVRLLMVVGLDEALEFVARRKASPTPPSLESVGLSKDGVYASDDYGSVYDMTAHGRHRSAEQLLGFSVFSCLLMKILRLSGYVRAPENSSEFAETGGLLLRHLEVVQCNAKRIVELQQPDRFDDTKPEELGIGIYPSAALLNHSCDPSADLSSFGNSLVVRATRNVNEGEEIAVSYGPLFYETKELRRQAELREAYFFSCRFLSTYLLGADVD